MTLFVVFAVFYGVGYLHGHAAGKEAVAAAGRKLLGMFSTKDK